MTIIIFIYLQALTSGSQIANTDGDLQFLSWMVRMLGELTNIPTGTLIDMVSVILAGDIVLTASDVAELEQIQRELQRRANVDDWVHGRHRQDYAKEHLKGGWRMSGTRRRNRVVAEITLAHMRQLAMVFGCAATEEEVLTFLNENGHAYGMWMCMMQAAEDFIRNNLREGLRTSHVRQVEQESVAAETCYFLTYPTADGRSVLNNNLRI